MAAVPACGPRAVLSNGSAAAFWEIGAEGRCIEVSVPAASARRRSGIIVHRRVLRPAELTTRHGIPVTTPECTLIDIAPRLSRAQLEAAVNEADKRSLTNPDRLRALLLPSLGRPGVARLRRVLDRRTFVLTDSELERRFLPLARAASLPAPQTGRRVSGFKVDFYWPDLGLVVETDGLRYHRTPAEQARDRVRDQAHTAAGFTCLRFTHAQVRFEPDHVIATLGAVRRRLTGAH
jgi:very-short-patch-repair endonuclease